MLETHIDQMCKYLINYYSVIAILAWPPLTPSPPLPLSLTLLPVPPSPPPPPPPHMLCLAALVWPLPSLAGGRSRCPELANNNQGVALCDTPSLGLDNEQAPNSRFAGEWQPPEHGPMRAEDWECRDGGWREIQEERKREESYLQRTKGFLMH